MRRTLVLVALVLPLAPLSGAQAWVATPAEPHHADLSELAARRLPEPERGLILRNLAAFREGAVAPDLDTHPFFHTYEPADGGGGAVYMLQRSLHEAATALREGRPEDEVARLLGRMTHYSMDLSVPFHTGRDAYAHPYHAAMETQAWERRAELRVPEGPPPRAVEDVEARTLLLARRSAELAPPLVEAMDRAEGGWSPEVARLVEESAGLGVEATADLLLTAFAWGDPSTPARPAPQGDDLPLPKDLEDLGWDASALAPSPRAAATGLALLGVLLLGGAAYARRRMGRLS